MALRTESTLGNRWFRYSRIFYRNIEAIRELCFETRRRKYLTALEHIDSSWHAFRRVPSLPVATVHKYQRSRRRNFNAAITGTRQAVGNTNFRSVSEATRTVGGVLFAEANNRTRGAVRTVTIEAGCVCVRANRSIFDRRLRQRAARIVFYASSLRNLSSRKFPGQRCLHSDASRSAPRVSRDFERGGARSWGTFTEDSRRRLIFG